MKSNIETLLISPHLKRYNVPLEIRQWSALPPFHEFLYAERLLIARWMPNDAGQLHVRTPLWEIDKQRFPQRFEEARTRFENAQ